MVDITRIQQFMKAQRWLVIAAGIVLTLTPAGAAVATAAAFDEAPIAPSTASRTAPSTTIGSPEANCMDIAWIVGDEDSDVAVFIIHNCGPIEDWAFCVGAAGSAQCMFLPISAIESRAALQSLIASTAIPCCCFGTIWVVGDEGTPASVFILTGQCDQPGDWAFCVAAAGSAHCAMPPGSTARNEESTDHEPAFQLLA